MNAIPNNAFDITFSLLSGFLFVTTRLQIWVYNPTCVNEITLGDYIGTKKIIKKSSLSAK